MRAWHDLCGFLRDPTRRGMRSNHAIRDRKYRALSLEKNGASRIQPDTGALEVLAILDAIRETVDVSSRNTRQSGGA
jgi:hypothetical protein